MLTCLPLCVTAVVCTPVMQMVIVSDPLLVDSIVGRSTELEKSTSVFYDQFNVVSELCPSHLGSHGLVI